MRVTKFVYENCLQIFFEGLKTAARDVFTPFLIYLFEFSSALEHLK